MKKRIGWDIVIDLILLVIFWLLTICLIFKMIIIGLNKFELFLLFVTPIIADESFQ